MGDLGCLKMLAENGADLAAPSAEGFTALSAAFFNKGLTLEQIQPVVEYLMANADFGIICSPRSFSMSKIAIPDTSALARECLEQSYEY